MRLRSWVMPLVAASAVIATPWVVSSRASTCEPLETITVQKDELVSTIVRRMATTHKLDGNIDYASWVTNVGIANGVNPNTIHFGQSLFIPKPGSICLPPRP